MLGTAVRVVVVVRGSKLCKSSDRPPLNLYSKINTNLTDIIVHTSRRHQI